VTATTLEFVSTSTEDAAGQTGLYALLVQGTDVNFDTQEELIFITGTTPISTTLSFRTMRLVLGVVGGTNDGAVGTITCVSNADATEWGRITPGETTMETGRYTCANGETCYVVSAIQNASAGSDITVRFYNQVESGYPLALGEVYVGSGFLNYTFGTIFPIPPKATIIARVFSNAGNPQNRKVNVTLTVLAAIDAAFVDYLFTEF